MPIPLIALAAGAIGFSVFDRSRRQTAFNTALESFAAQPGGTDPGSVTGAQLTQRQVIGLQDLYRANPAAALAQLNGLQGRNQTAHQNSLTRELQWQQLGQARQSFTAQTARDVEQVRQFEIRNDANEIRLRTEAADLGAIYVDDPLNNNARTRTAAPGSVEWRELQAKAIATGFAANTINELIQSEAKFGVIRDRSAPGFGTQQSLRRRLVGELKEVLTLGALDAGLLLFATGLVGDELAIGDFILGDDALSLERLLTTQGLFTNLMTLRKEDLRLLQGVNPALQQGFDQVQQDSALLQQFVTERISDIRQVGGNVSDLVQQPGETFLGNQARGGPVQLQGAPPSALQSTRAAMSVFGNEAGAAAGAAAAFALGRFLPRSL